jgi:hypothetical protein
MFVFLAREKLKHILDILKRKSLKLHSDDSNPSTLNCLEYEGAMEYHLFLLKFLNSLHDTVRAESESA